MTLDNPVILYTLLLLFTPHYWIPVLYCMWAGVFRAKPRDEKAWVFDRNRIPFYQQIARMLRR